jgi:nitrate reductase beta subunit
MRIRAQVGMVMNLDKCIGCHTCSVTCKNVWTNRDGAEYMWFNDVETKPGVGYPKRWEDQDAWNGGWELNRKGRLELKSGSRSKRLFNIFFNPDLPSLDDYYEPFTFDYDALTSEPASEHQPVARPLSAITGEPMDIEWGPNWEDDLAGAPEHAPADPNLRGIEDAVRMEYERVFMMYLPRICEHCLNPSCVASCPSGAMYKREEDGIVLVDQEACRGWRMCVSNCPYKKVYFNWQSGKAEKCTLCYPRIEAGMPTVCSETCVGRIRYIGVVLYDADRVEEAASVADEKDLLDAQLSVFLDPEDPEVRRQAVADGIPADWMDAARRSPGYALAMRHRVTLPLHPE